MVHAGAHILLAGLILSSASAGGYLKGGGSYPAPAPTGGSYPAPTPTAPPTAKGTVYVQPSGGSYVGDCKLGCPTASDIDKFKKDCIKVSCSAYAGRGTVSVSNTGACTGYASSYSFIALTYTDSYGKDQAMKIEAGKYNADIPGGLKCGSNVHVYSHDGAKCSLYSNLLSLNLGTCTSLFNDYQKLRGCDWGNIAVDCAAADQMASQYVKCPGMSGACVQTGGGYKNCACQPPVYYGPSKPKDTLCNAKSTYAGNECDADDYCDGSSASCNDQVAAANTVCKSKGAELCDADDMCDGSSKICKDVVQPNTYKCRASDPYKQCDQDDYCSGNDGDKTCANAVLPANTPCRPPNGPCDKDDVCDGTTDTCVDKVHGPKYVCACPTCDYGTPSTCNGGKDCPPNNSCDAPPPACYTGLMPNAAAEEDDVIMQPQAVATY
ncbi:hypothetical protein JKP88DRAFT_305290 [Tribonema minus]|uniref:Uncharacterized protein n=1 Tax=Tribonema minus TaxID=303371 RepID=A0A835Z708_9STRA|nr:hypothetical protein JKP88DRAFT_305290 [Tribonema minus]